MLRVLMTTKKMSQKTTNTVTILLLLISEISWVLTDDAEVVSFRKCFNGTYCFTLISFEEDNRTTFTLDHAQNSCRNISSTLAEITNTKIQNYTHEFLEKSAEFISTSLSRRNVLVNGRQHNNNTWYWVNGNPVNISGLTNVEVINNNTFGSITITNYSVTITALPPNSKQSGYICEFTNKSLDVSNCTVLHNGRCYRIYSGSNETWYSARNKCLNREGDLASFDLMTHEASLDSLNRSQRFNSSTKYWIGMRSSWWTWETSGTDILNTNWENPTEDNTQQYCVSLNSFTGSWMKCSCNNSTLPLNYLCLHEFGKATERLSNYATTDATSYQSCNSKTSALALGLGLGLGLGVPTIAFIIVLMIILVDRRRRRKQSTLRSSDRVDFTIQDSPSDRKAPLYPEVKPKNSKETEQVTASVRQNCGNYAQVQKNIGENTTVADKPTNEGQTVYSNVTIESRKLK